MQLDFSIKIKAFYTCDKTLNVITIEQDLPFFSPSHEDVFALNRTVESFRSGHRGRVSRLALHLPGYVVYVDITSLRRNGHSLEHEYMDNLSLRVWAPGPGQPKPSVVTSVVTSVENRDSNFALVFSSLIIDLGVRFPGVYGQVEPYLWFIQKLLEEGRAK